MPPRAYSSPVTHTRLLARGSGELAPCAQHAHVLQKDYL